MRLLTIVSCALVIGATIRTLKLNFDHYPPALSSPLSASSSPGYYPWTDIPTSFLGVFWSTLHHTSLLVVLVIVILSELSLPIPLLHRLFKNTLPFLGPNWGTGFLGVLLVLVAGDVLSRGSVGGKFVEASSWCLAGLGVANVGVGVVWRAKAKVVRSPMGWKADVAERMEKLAEAKEKAERVVDQLPLPAGWKAKGENQTQATGRFKGFKEFVGKLVANQFDKCNPNTAQQSKEKVVDLEKAEVQTSNLVPGPNSSATTARAMDIFAPSLPSAIVASRSTVPGARQATEAVAPASLGLEPGSFSSTFSGSTVNLTVPPSARTRTDVTASPQPTRSASTSTISTAFSSTLDAPPSESISLTSQPPLVRTKTVRFVPTPSPNYEHARIESPTPPPGMTEVGVRGEKFLLLPTSTRLADGQRVGLCDGERSPSVMASLKAAMLEAEAKAKANQSKKSIYLGSHKWLADYKGATDDPVHMQHSSDNQNNTGDKKAQQGPTRPYNFL